MNIRELFNNNKKKSFNIIVKQLRNVIKWKNTRDKSNEVNRRK